MAKTLLILIITFFLAQMLNSTEIYGVPKIIDGDTIHINNKKIKYKIAGKNSTPNIHLQTV